MPVLVGPSLVVSMLLVVAGAQKLVDPQMTVGALRAMRLPAGELLVRAGSAVEVAIGVAAIASGLEVLWVVVGVSYVAFAVFTAAALKRGTMIGTCGCFGREETPPHALHVFLDLALAATAFASMSLPRSPLEELVAAPAEGAMVAVFAAAALYLVYALFVELPRALAAARSVPG